MARGHAHESTRYQNLSTIQTTKATPGVIRRILVSNADVAVQTVTLTDGATVWNVIRQAPGTSQVYELGANFSTSIKVTPSSVNLDVTVIWE